MFINNKKRIVSILLIFLISRIFITTIFYISEGFEKQGMKRVNTGGAYYIDIPVVKYFVFYDTYHYMNIAKYDYGNSETYPKLENHNYVDDMEACYFPLFPWLIRMFLFTGIPGVIIGFIISNLSFIIFLFIFKAILLNLGIESDLPLIIMSIFPGSIFLSTVYTESLCVMLSTLCIYMAMKKKWAFAALAGFLAGMTRITGVLLCLLILLEYMKDINWNIKKIRWNILLCSLPGLGLAVFMLVNQIYYGSPIKFITMEKIYMRKFVDPVSYLLADVLSGNFKNILVASNLVPMYAMTIVMVAMFLDKRVSLSHKIYTALVAFIAMSSIFAPTSDAPFYTVGYIRYMLPAIPLFVYLGRLPKLAQVSLLSIFMICLTAMSLFFYAGLFIA